MAGIFNGFKREKVERQQNQSLNNARKCRKLDIIRAQIHKYTK